MVGNNRIDAVKESILVLPSDVSNKTFDEHGEQISKIWDYWGKWICFINVINKPGKNYKNSPFLLVTTNAIDYFQAAIFNAISGYYREGFSVLRNILEQITIGLSLEISKDINKFNDWIKGDSELGFGRAVGELIDKKSKWNKRIRNCEDNLFKSYKDNLFRKVNKKNGDPGGYTRRIFKSLSQYVHGAPGYNNAYIWKSNGPIYVREKFQEFVNTFTKVYVFGVLEVILLEPKNIKFLKCDKNSYEISGFINNMIDNLIPKDGDSSLLKNFLSIIQKC